MAQKKRPTLPFSARVGFLWPSQAADGEGFEPSVRFWRTHDFQSCSFDHSDTRPRCEAPAPRKPPEGSAGAVYVKGDEIASFIFDFRRFFVLSEVVECLT